MSNKNITEKYNFCADLPNTQEPTVLESDIVAFLGEHLKPTAAQLGFDAKKNLNYYIEHKWNIGLF